MAKANDIRNKLNNQSTRMGAAGGIGGSLGSGKSELSKMIESEAKKKSGGASGAGHVLNKQLGKGGGPGANNPVGGSGGAKGVPRRPSTNKGP